MRIRTIKPEFWSHPVMGRLSADLKCLALALLNYADDEGYFSADPMLVRNSTMPFMEDYRAIHGMLTELANVGWIEVRSNPEYGEVGKIAKFSEHQVVNRVTPSKIRKYFDSGSTHGVITEESHNTPTRKGREGKGREEYISAADAPVCDSLDLEMSGESTRLTTVPKTGIKQAKVERKRTDLEVEVSRLYWDGLVKKSGMKFTKAQQAAQGKHLWELVDRTIAQFGHSDALGATATILGTFYRLKSDDRTTSGFMRGQSPTPMSLAGAAVWGKVLEAMRENRMSPEERARKVEVYGEEFVREYERTMS